MVTPMRESGQIVPDPTKGLWAAVLTRDADGWRYAGTSQEVVAIAGGYASKVIE
jgi:hypothetical protein